VSGANLSGSGRPSGSGRLSGASRLESAGKARRGPGWAQLGRRGEPAEAAPQGEAELRAVAVRGTEPPAEEHHLGDRLSAFVDGELGHDSRDRVQSHLATCPECLAEADEGRAVKHLLTHTGTPAPSTTLMARLLAVAALPDDEEQSGGPGGGATAAAGTIGGSRLTGGSFGRGAGASFGGGALGADTPLPGVDPRAGRPDTGFLSSRRTAAPRSLMPRPLAALTEAPAVRPAAPRGRRFVFAAAGAFSVAAVTLGGVGGVSSVTGEDQHGTAVTPVRGPGGNAVVPMTAQLPVDFPVYPARASHGAGTVPQTTYSPTALQHQLR